VEEVYALEVQNLCVNYGRKTVLQDVTLAIPKGALACILGPNGAGKSTLLKAVMGLIPSSYEKISFLKEPFASARQKIAYVPQRSSVDWDFPVSVLDVVSMGCFRKKGLFGRLTKQDREFIHWCCEQVGLDGVMNRQIKELSGGQQQKVFIARALASKPEIYLMDEPFAGVDMATEKAIIDLLKKLQTEGKTIILVHHDLHCVREYFDFAVFLHTRLIDSGNLSQVFHRENVSRTYGGFVPFLEGEL
jgi:manganese/zinc/iron transport system ATP- binding protein